METLNGIQTTDKQMARRAGLLYLTIAIFGGFAHIYVRERLYVADNAAETSANILDNLTLVRIGVAADLIQSIAFILLALTLHQTLKKYGEWLARTFLTLVAIAVPMIALNMTFQMLATIIVDSDAYTNLADSDTIVLLLMDLQFYGYLLAGAFFGLWLVPLGLLMVRSRRFPKALGLMLMVGGVCYLSETFTHLLHPSLGDSIGEILVVPSAIAEIWMIGYLLIKGIREQPALTQ